MRVLSGLKLAIQASNLLIGPLAQEPVDGIFVYDWSTPKFFCYEPVMRLNNFAAGVSSTAGVKRSRLVAAGENGSSNFGWALVPACARIGDNCREISSAISSDSFNPCDGVHLV